MAKKTCHSFLLRLYAHSNLDYGNLLFSIKCWVQLALLLTLQENSSNQASLPIQPAPFSFFFFHFILLLTSPEGWSSNFIVEEPLPLLRARVGYCTHIYHCIILNLINSAAQWCLIWIPTAIALCNENDKSMKEVSQGWAQKWAAFQGVSFLSTWSYVLHMQYRCAFAQSPTRRCLAVCFCVGLVESVIVQKCSWYKHIWRLMNFYYLC